MKFWGVCYTAINNMGKLSCGGGRLSRKRPSGLQPPCVVHRHCGSPRGTGKPHPRYECSCSSGEASPVRKHCIHLRGSTTRRRHPSTQTHNEPGRQGRTRVPPGTRPGSGCRALLLRSVQKARSRQAPRGQGAGAASRARWAVIPQFPQRVKHAPLRLPLLSALILGERSKIQQNKFV